MFLPSSACPVGAAATSPAAPTTAKIVVIFIVKLDGIVSNEDLFIENILERKAKRHFPKPRRPFGTITVLHICSRVICIRHLWSVSRTEILNRPSVITFPLPTCRLTVTSVLLCHVRFVADDGADGFCLVDKPRD